MNDFKLLLYNDLMGKITTSNEFSRGVEMFHCPLCQTAAHARTSRYHSTETKERYHQCQNVNCSATFVTLETVKHYIVKPGERTPVLPHPMQGGQQQIHWM
ncbi:DNA-binding transcriptional regulator [Buttiauxella sp. 3AFRM03]|nr:DNA-binding transcriptional regulator [Buttiauxella sp. 3AFRM03]